MSEQKKTQLAAVRNVAHDISALLTVEGLGDLVQCLEGHESSPSISREDGEVFEELMDALTTELEGRG